MLDKVSGRPRGIAFVEMFSVAEASRALAALQGATLPGNAQPLRLCYARDKFGGQSQGVDAGAEALEAAQVCVEWEGARVCTCVQGCTHDMHMCLCEKVFSAERGVVGVCVCHGRSLY